VSVLLTALAVSLGAVVALGATTAPAAAHDALVSTAPADGSSVAHAPARVVLTFDQPALALGTAIVVTSPSGQQVQAGAPSLVDNTVSQALQPGSPAGAYTVVYRVTSADGHPISGRIAFDARAASTGVAAGDPTPEPAPTAVAPPVAGGAGALPWVGLLVALAVVAVVLVLLRRSTDRRTP